MNSFISRKEKLLIFTESAISQAEKITKPKDSKIRIYIEGGGCRGLQYKFTLDHIINIDDTVFKNNGSVFLIDFVSIQYLVGATIDFHESLKGSYFIVKNPNAKTTCNCGSSFDIE